MYMLGNCTIFVQILDMSSVRTTNPDMLASNLDTKPSHILCSRQENPGIRWLPTPDSISRTNTEDNQKIEILSVTFGAEVTVGTSGRF
jgi:hypothetical protein